MTCAPWPISWPCDTTAVDPDLVTMAEESAIGLLWAMSGRRLGPCTYIEGYWPPCSAGCGSPYKGADGQWRNGGWADCCRFLLAHRPVQTVTEVLEWGIVLDPAEYATDGTWLRRRGSCWPCGQSCDDPPLVVTYDAGVPLPVGTAMAVGEVACEFLRGFQSQPCKLPSRVVNISRQGVTMDLGSAEDFTNAGRLGLPIADAWLTLVNPGALRRPSGVWSPDLARST